MKTEDAKINVKKQEGETMAKSENYDGTFAVKSNITVKEMDVKIEAKIKSNADETMVRTENTADNTMISIEETRGEVVERLVNDEYKQWKQNTPFLYDFLISHALDWPSMTVEWIPHRVDSSDGPYSLQKIILGTNSEDNEPNFLIIAQVKLPLLYDRSYDEEYGNLDAEDDRYELVSGVGCKIQVLQQIIHDGEVYRARHMPQDPSIIATKTDNPEVHIFDYRNHPTKHPIGDGKSSPDLRLTGQQSDGFGLSWSTINHGFLLSGSCDSRICMWNLNQTPVNKALNAFRTFTAYTGPIEDLAWHLKDAHMFASCDANRYLHVYDIRAPCVPSPVKRLRAHQSEISCLSFNPFNEWLLATGSTDKTVKIFDLRKFTSPLFSFDHHKDEIIQVGWSPHHEEILASSCAGRRLMVWDASRIGMEQSSEDAEDGPPELLFIHGGHTDKVADFSWNPREEWLIASTADDNMLQVWQMADHIYSE